MGKTPASRALGGWGRRPGSPPRPPATQPHRPGARVSGTRGLGEHWPRAQSGGHPGRFPAPLPRPPQLRGELRPDVETAADRRHSPAAAPGWASGTAHRAVRPPALRAAGEGQRSGWRDTAQRSSLRGTCHRALGAPRPPPPFAFFRTCSLSGGRCSSSPARWGSPPADGKEGVAGGGERRSCRAGARVPPPLRGRVCLNSASAAPPPALRRGPGVRPDGGGGGRRRGMRPHPGAHTPHSQAAGPGLQGRERGGRSTLGTLSRVKSLELGR